MTEASANEVLKFWFDEITPEQWWKKDDSFDETIKERFESTLKAAARSELFDWRESARGRLAEIIVLDQFSRNIYRDHPQAFASDGLALALSQEAVRRGCLEELSQNKRAFLIMPYMHSESLKVHNEALVLFEKYAEKNLDFERKHRDIIERFGRYPHRNNILARTSTQEEVEFLKQPGSSF